MEMPPLTPEAQEAFFQEQVAEGEKLATLGECWCFEMHSPVGRIFVITPALTPRP